MNSSQIKKVLDAIYQHWNEAEQSFYETLFQDKLKRSELFRSQRFTKISFPSRVLHFRQQLLQSDPGWLNFVGRVSAPLPAELVPDLLLFADCEPGSQIRLKFAMDTFVAGLERWQKRLDIGVCLLLTAQQLRAQCLQ
jgi:hypothetical protein